MNKSIQGNANGIVEQAKQTVAHVASDAKAGVTTQLEQRIDQAKEIGIEKIETVSDALRGASEKLEGTGPLPELAEKAAQGIENLAHYFENKTVGDLFTGVQTFARRDPALFLGGAVALGLLAGRFLKSSSRRSASTRYAASGGDRFETYGYEGEYGTSSFGSEGDYLSADDLEDDWEAAETSRDTAEQPMAFEAEASPLKSSFDSRSTQPQGSSEGAVGFGASPSTTDEKKDDFFGNKSSG